VATTTTLGRLLVEVPTTEAAAMAPVMVVGMVAEEETAAETGEAYKAVFAPVRNDP
jgi:hypothetical protein